jgi:hypothetical protein
VRNLARRAASAVVIMAAVLLLALTLTKGGPTYVDADARPDLSMSLDVPEVPLTEDRPLRGALTATNSGDLDAALVVATVDLAEAPDYRDDIAFSLSYDEGRTWTAPVPLGTTGGDRGATLRVPVGQTRELLLELSVRAGASAPVISAGLVVDASYSAIYG